MTEESVSHWRSRVRAGGADALLAHRPPGRPPALSPAQRLLISELLWHGAEAYGFRGAL